MNQGGWAGAVPGGVLSLLLLVAWGCGGPDSGQEADGSVPLWEGEVEVLFGSLEGPVEELVGAFGGIVPLEDGRVVIADRASHHLKVFTPDGTWLFNVGRDGEGPGELRGPCCPGRDGDGGIWVRETGGGRYQAFEPREDGFQATATRPIAHGAAGLHVRTTVRGDTLVDTGHRPDPGTGQLTRVRHHLRPGDGVLREEVVPEPPPEATGTHSVARETEAGRSVFYVHQPFGPRFLYDQGPDGAWASAVSSEYRVRWVLPDGTEREIRGAVTEGPLLSEAEEERGAEAVEADARMLGTTVASLPYRVPRRKPPLAGLLLAADGRLWVLLSRAEGSEWREAEVWGRGGSLEARARWPAAVDPEGSRGWAEGDVLYGLHRGELDEPRGARVRFHRD